MYNDEFNNNDMYRFTNRDVPHDDYAPAPRQENTPAAPAQRSGFFHRTWVKITALVLACVVAGGAAGYFAPRRERFLCLRRPHFFQQRKKWGKERRQKLRFCTSSARYTALVCKAAPPRNRHFLTRCRSADCASTAFRCRCPLLR